METKVFVLETLWERENGKRYRGFSWEGELKKWDVGIGWEIFEKEAQEISSQSIKVAYQCDYLKSGYSLNWLKWKNNKILLYLAGTLPGWGEAGIETDLISRWIVGVNIRRKISFASGMYFEPLMVYKRVGSKEFFQFKIRVGYDFKTGGKVHKS